MYVLKKKVNFAKNLYKKKYFKNETFTNFLLNHSFNLYVMYTIK